VFGLDCSAVVTAAGVGDGSIALAECGMAAALGAHDAPADHVTDTLRVGGGIADSRVALVLKQHPRSLSVGREPGVSTRLLLRGVHGTRLLRISS